MEELCFNKSITNKLPKIGFGTYSLHGDIINKSIETAISNGILLFDTAYKYENETELFNAVVKTGYNISDIYIQTKVCQRQLLGSLSKLRLDKQSVKQAFKKSLNRLNKIDVFLIHSYFDGCEKFYKDLIRLRDEGLVPFVGICNCNQQQLQHIYNCVGEYPMVIQVEIHPYNSQKKIIEFCHNNNILIEARSPFAHGDVMQEWYANKRILDIANSYNKTIPQIILRWLIQQNIIPIYRSKNINHISENIDINDFSLTLEQMNTIDKLNKDISFGFVSNK